MITIINKYNKLFTFCWMKRRMNLSWLSFEPNKKTEKNYFLLLVRAEIYLKNVILCTTKITSSDNIIITEPPGLKVAKK